MILFIYFNVLTHFESDVTLFEEMWYWSCGEVIAGCDTQAMANPVSLAWVPVQTSQQAIPGLGPQRVHLILAVNWRD